MTRDFKILLDTPAEGDLALGFDDLAIAFADVVQNSDPRFAIGLFGGWGSGKTTLMHAIEKRLNRNRCIPVWFSAWRYEKEQHLIVPLLDVVREGLVEWSDRRRSSAQQLSKTALEVADTIGKAVYSLVAGFSLKAGLPGGPQLSFNANKALAKAEEFDHEAKEARVPRSFYHASFAALSAAFNKFCGRKGDRRIVIFIDDLDRCLAEGALEVLESMKLFFDLPGFIFVVGLDRQIVELSVDKRYREILPAGGEGNELVSGAQYLRKIFQVPYTLAPISISQIDEFLSVVQPAAKLPQGQWDEINNQVRPHLRFLIGESGVNPREIKRFINSYTLVRKTRSWLDTGVVLSLQTIAFRPDWERIHIGILTFRDLFLDTLRRHLDQPGAGHFEELDPDLSMPQSFLDFVGADNPGKALVDYQGPIDEFIFSGEATRQTDGTQLLSLFRAMGDLIQTAKNAKIDDGTFELGHSPVEPFEEKARHALSIYSSLRGTTRDHIMSELEALLENRDGGKLQIFAELSGDKKFSSPAEAFGAGRDELLEVLRRIMRNLQELYKAGAL